MSKSELSINHLPELISEGIIDEATSIRIEKYLKTKYPESHNRLLGIFAILGSLLVGLGIILIIAHNWDDFSKSLKTILCFIPVVIGQGFVVFSYFKKREQAAWTEGSSTFLYLVLGAAWQ